MLRQLLDFQIPYILYAPEGSHREADVYLTKDLFSRLAGTVTPQNVLMEVEIPKESAFTQGSVLILDGVQDPGNLGTILRSSLAFGVENILSLKGTVSWTNEKVLRSSMGSIFALSIREEAEREDIEALKEEGYTLLGADMEGEDYLSVALPRKWALVIGSEGRGITEETRALIDSYVSIPMKGKMESLNAAVAASILMLELTQKEGSRHDL